MLPYRAVFTNTLTGQIPDSECRAVMSLSGPLANVICHSISIWCVNLRLGDYIFWTQAIYSGHVVTNFSWTVRNDDILPGHHSNWCMIYDMITGLFTKQEYMYLLHLELFLSEIYRWHMAVKAHGNTLWWPHLTHNNTIISLVHKYALHFDCHQLNKVLEK